VVWAPRLIGKPEGPNLHHWHSTGSCWRPSTSPSRSLHGHTTWAT